MSNHEAPSNEPQLEKVWDPVVRLTHWAMVVTVISGYLIGENMSFSNINWHFWLGYGTGAVVLIRLLWGLVGPRPARLASLFYAPVKILGYLSSAGARKPSYWPGHNPLGALSALALWAVLAGMVVTGLMSESEDFFATGPLGAYIDSDLRLTMTAWHDRLHAFVLPLVGLHLAAILFYAVWKKENLVRPMVTGWKLVRRR